MDVNHYPIWCILILLGLASTPLDGQIRSYDGYGNNELSPLFGAVGAPLRQVTPLAFADSISAPNGLNRPNPRQISNTVFAQPGYIYDQHELSDYIWVFGQFIDHDITLVDDSETEPAFVMVPPCDPVFDPLCQTPTIIPMMRSLPMEGTGTSTDNPRQYSNAISAFIDGSAVYGSDQDRADWLRSFTDGKLKTSTGDLLPFNTLNGELEGIIDENAPHMANPIANNKRWFVAGDVRANENVLLTAIHTLFVLEHNRLCDELKLTHPEWTDEQLYQRARKIVGGIIQAITYEEWLPTMGVTLDPYSGYKSDVDPNISNVFSAAAYRFGHSLLSKDILRMNDGCETMPSGNMTLRQAFFNPSLVVTSGLDPLFKGMSAQIQQELDCRVVDDVRNFLFGPPGSGMGMDLAAININRGRERGLADYNTIRDALGLGRIRSFQENFDNPEDGKTMEELYGSVDNIDPWVGMLAEKHMPGALFGETVMTILKDQFQVLRDGDNFYYPRDPELSQEEKEMIRNTTMADVVRRNTNLEALQDNVFRMVRTCRTVDIRERHLELLVYPNPIESEYDITIFSFEEGTANLFTTDLLGQIVNQEPVHLYKGINTISLSLNSGLPRGIYNLQISLGHRQNTIKVFKR